MFPVYTVTEDPQEPDRLHYAPDRLWPVPRPGSQRLVVLGRSDVVTFDDTGRPSDVRYAVSANAHSKLQARRMTPKAEPLPM